MRDHTPKPVPNRARVHIRSPRDFSKLLCGKATSENDWIPWSASALAMHDTASCRLCLKNYDSSRDSYAPYAG